MSDPAATIEAPLPDGCAGTRFAGAEKALADAYSALDAGDPALAEAALGRALAIDPAFTEAHGALAELLAERARPAEAVPHYRHAVAGDPGRVAWWRGLASALEGTGDEDGAIAACRALLDRRADDAPTHRRLARLLARAGLAEAALDHAREARFLDGDRLSSVAEIAEATLLAGDPLQAVELLQPALRRAHADDPARRDATLLLASAWAALGEGAKASAALTTLPPLDDGPDVAAVRAAIAAADAGLSPTFVRTLFDRYADRFEADLLDKLAYAGPRLIADALDRLQVGGGLRVLDAGCGTGLAGPVLRDRAAWLAGVDLAPRMVERARAKGVYDSLRVGELVGELSDQAAAWDLIVAADVLVYVGDLAPVFAAAAAALRPGGLFVLTTERAVAEGGFLLQESRRYAHGAAYLRATATAAGLSVALLEDCSARRDRGAPVPGLLAALRRPA